jgi:palmitoyltransferase
MKRISKHVLNKKFGDELLSNRENSPTASPPNPNPNQDPLPIPEPSLSNLSNEKTPSGLNQSHEDMAPERRTTAGTARSSLGTKLISSPKPQTKYLFTLRRKFGIWFPYALIHVFCLPVEIVQGQTIIDNTHFFGVLLYSILGLLIVISFTMYFKIFFSNPGFIPRSMDPDFKQHHIEMSILSPSKAPSTNEEPRFRSLDAKNPVVSDQKDDVIVIRESVSDKRVCFICDIYKPPRSKHCYHCNRCVARFDHHCPFIGNCIGYKNHPLFWWFLLTEEIVLSWSIAFLVYGLSDVDMTTISGASQYAQIIYVLLGLLILGGFGLYVLMLLVLHTYLLLLNQTTYELILTQRAKNPNSGKTPPLLYGHGICENIKDFCSSKIEAEWIETASPTIEKQQQRIQQSARNPVQVKPPSSPAVAASLPTRSSNPTRSSVAAPQERSQVQDDRVIQQDPKRTSNPSTS